MVRQVPIPNGRPAEIITSQLLLRCVGPLSSNWENTTDTQNKARKSIMFLPLAGFQSDPEHALIYRLPPLSGHFQVKGCFRHANLQTAQESADTIRLNDSNSKASLRVALLLRKPLRLCTRYPLTFTRDQKRSSASDSLGNEQGQESLSTLLMRDPQIPLIQGFGGYCREGTRSPACRPLPTHLHKTLARKS